MGERACHLIYTKRNKEKQDWTRKEGDNTKSVYKRNGSSRTEYLEGFFFIFLQNTDQIALSTHTSDFSLHQL